MKIIFMGSPAFAVTSLSALLNNKLVPELIICQPDKPFGRGQKIKACPVAEFTRLHKLDIIQPKTLKEKDTHELIAKLKPDLIMVVAYGKILPPQILEIPRYGCINLHASLLPKYRGAAPINWAIVNGEEKTGVSIMMMNEKMDAGDILQKQEMLISPDETAIELYDRLATIGASVLIDTINNIEKYLANKTPQNHSVATLAPILKKTDGLINWASSAKQIHNLIRGLLPWPVAYTHIHGKLLKIFKAKFTEDDHKEREGTAIISNNNLAIVTGKGLIYPLEIQIEGKSRMDIKSFLHGYKINHGEIFS